jgi:Kelch motif
MLRHVVTSMLVLHLGASLASAHFLWVRVQPETALDSCRLLFSEGADVDSDILPDTIAGCEVFLRKSDQTRTQLLTSKSEGKGDAYLTATVGSASGMAVETSCHYGRHKDFLLDYCAKGIAFENPAQLAQLGRAPELPLDMVPELDGRELSVTLIKGEHPLSQVEATITEPDGETQKKTTDSSGKISLTVSKTGLYSFRANCSEPIPAGKGADNGESDQAATSRRTYVTLTLNMPSSLASATGQPASDTKVENSTAMDSPCPPLPEAIASFGAAVSGEYLYVYGGHTGKEHAHSRDNLSQSFRRIRLVADGTWESLPMEQPLQGLPLVATSTHLYRIGGLKALNSPGEEEDLHSVADAAYFDVRKQTWSPLPALPAGRSSHDAVVVGNIIYVVGGWNLEGTSPGVWHDTMLSLDTTQDTPAWKVHEGVPFQRRALTVASRGDQLYVIGGMNSNDEVDSTVDVYDISTSSWSSGPKLPGGDMDAFGVSAWTTNDQLYVVGMSGIVYRLSADGQSWEESARLREGRFFHRLLPLGSDRLIVVGGATRKGHLTAIESVAISH